MMKIFTFVLAFCVIQLAAQTSLPDSGLFSSNQEYEVFLNILNNPSADPFDLLLAIDANCSKEEISLQIQDYADELVRSGIQQKNIKKQVKTIYSGVHSKFLKKYNINAFFPDIFKSGEYNCVTATALYAILLERTGIDYSIKVAPEHAYLVADPEGIEAKIETTLPARGVLVFDEKFQRDFVDFLVESKMISQEEFQSTPVPELFESYYTSDKTINLKELAAIQYYNRGIFQFGEQKFAASCQNLEKAASIYPAENVRYALNVARINLFNEHLSTNEYDGKLLANFINANRGTPTSLQIGLEYFERAREEFAVNHPRRTKFQDFYFDFKHSVCDTIDVSDIDLSYFVGLAYLDYVHMKYASALASLKQAYVLNPENIRTRDLIHDASIKHLFKDFRHEALIDSLDKYFVVFPFLEEIDLFTTQYGYYHLRSIYTRFSYNQPEEGERIIERLAEARDLYPEMFLDPELVAYAFVKAAEYYLNQGSTKKAEQNLVQGLLYAPESLILKEAVKEFESFRVELEVMLAQQTRISNYRGYRLDRESITAFLKDEFPGCWKTTHKVSDSRNEDVPADEYFEIETRSDQQMTLKTSGGNRKMKWAARTKSRLLYFVDPSDKSNYIVYRIKYIDSETITLLPYEEGTERASYTLVLERCR